MEDISFQNINYLELEGLPNKFFSSNLTSFLNNLKAKLIGLDKNSILVLKGGNDIPRYDTDVVNYHFLQESNFYYLCGVRESLFTLIIDIKTSSATLFYKLAKDERTKIFMRIPSLEDIKKKYELDCLDFDDFYSYMAKKDPNKIFKLNGVNSDSKLEVEGFEFVFPEEFKYLESRVDDNPLIYEILADTRTIKNKHEIDLLASISNVTCNAHVEIIKNVKPNINERDMEILFHHRLCKEYYMRHLSYQFICACGNNSSTLHYIENDRILKDGDLFLFDIGAKLVGYSSDVTSTIPINGKFSDKQKGIYNLVLKANRDVISLLKPGVYWPEMHLEAEKIILIGLQELGLLKNNFSVDDLISSRVAYYFMPHGLGHFLGLEVHDVGGYLSFTPERSDKLGLNRLRTSRYLASGNIITVEPGIYFIEILLEQAFGSELLSKYFDQSVIKSYYGFGGVRIEDDVLITNSGCINLTESLPRTVEEIEKLMQN